MTRSYLRGHGTRVTPQSRPMRPDQAANSAGGFAWAIDCWTRLRRFLVLGSEGGSYYAGERQLTVENVEALHECLAADHARTVEEIVAVSAAGRAPKNDQAVFSLAAAAATGAPQERAAALARLPEVCRTGTHLFQFVTFVEGFRGWGRQLRRAVGAWYARENVDQLALQVIKYRQRDGVTHRDVLRLAHPAAKVGGRNPLVDGLTPDHYALFHFLSGNPTRAGEMAEPHSLVEGLVRAQQAETPAETAALVREYRLPREAVKPEHLTAPEVWEALLDDIPMTALIRNLASMTRIGLLTSSSDATGRVLDQLADGDRLRRARVHPVAVLVALMTYAAGYPARGRGEPWTPVPRIVDALDAAFYAAFGNVESTGKRWLLALDVSGSMDSDTVAGVPNLTPRMAAAAMALVTASAEDLYEVVGFSAAGPQGWKSPLGSQRFYGHDDGLTPLALSPRQRLDDVMRLTDGLPFGGTDCALPMVYALDQGREVDVFVIYTDSETWAGSLHPAQALTRYREKTGIPARLVVCGMTSNGFSIADPNDPGMLDVVGFDTATPQLIADFAAERI